MKKKMLFVMILALFASCAPLSEPVISPKEDPLEDPIWSPEPLHVYVMDAAAAIVTDYDSVAMGWTYGDLLQAVRGQVAIYNRDHIDQRYVIGGGASA